jgi:hypothetical protein
LLLEKTIGYLNFDIFDFSYRFLIK